MGVRYVTVAEAAALLRLSDSTIRRRLESGNISGYRFGERSIRIPASELRAFVSKSRTDSGDAGTHDRTGSNQDLVTKAG
jgi:excisionase family DNA binding protein